MKSYFSKALVVVSILLVVALAAIKWSDNAQLNTADGTINDYSNRLDTAQSQIAVRDGDLLTLSNSLADCTSASLALSNQLAEARSNVALQTEQITNLNRQLAEAESENQTLTQSVMDLTNQVTGLTKEIALTEANLEQENTDYAVLETRLRQDVAERLVMERKFNNLTELQTQTWYLEQNPSAAISAGSIYKGLDLEVNSNGTIRVLSPD
jgi:chromosome segregation ATPase